MATTAAVKHKPTIKLCEDLPQSQVLREKMSRRLLSYAILAFLYSVCINAFLEKENHEDFSEDLNDPSDNAWIEADEVFPGVESYCLYFSVENIEFDLPDNVSFNSSWLMQEYSHHSKPQVDRDSSATIKLRYRFENLSNSDLSNSNLFTFTAIFQKKRRPNECSEDTWSMTQLSHENKTANSSVSYVYKTNKVGAADNRHYHCKRISFTSDSGDAKITLTNITIQPFLNGTKLSSNMVTCKKTYDYDYVTYIISSGMGVSVILAVIVIIISCLTKRLKYGKYNLLDT